MSELKIGNVCFLFDPPRKQVLLLKRNREPMKSLYTGVGGKTGFTEDIYSSALREIKEETGFAPSHITLKAVVKTILDVQPPSSWILFAYVGKVGTKEVPHCDEGTLEWVDLEELPKKPLIGFIREIMPHLIRGESLLECTLVHDQRGCLVQNRDPVRL